MLKYSNGWGHLIMSLATMAVGLYLIIGTKDVAYNTTGYGLIATVVAAWFVPGAAKQVATSVTDQVSAQPSQTAAQTSIQTAAAAVQTAMNVVQAAAVVQATTSATAPVAAPAGGNDATNTTAS